MSMNPTHHDEFIYVHFYSRLLRATAADHSANKSTSLAVYCWLHAWISTIQNGQTYGHINVMLVNIFTVSSSDLDQLEAPCQNTFSTLP